MIYFDHNATTPLDETVLDAMLPYLNKVYGNPSSLYSLGRISKSAIDTAREQVADLIDSRAEDIIFTSGGTEANALAIKSLRDKTLYISAVEHPSVSDNCSDRPVAANVLAVDDQGKICTGTQQWQQMPSDSWVSIMTANNETGVIQDLNKLIAECHARGIHFHTDAVQALGKLDFSFRKLNLDMASLSSHKIYGPKGCGALVVKNNTLIKALQSGGNQEHALRAGTENVAAIVGFGKAAEIAKQSMQQVQTRLIHLRNYLQQELLKFENIHIFSAYAERLANTVQFAIENQQGEMLLMQLDQMGIAVSSGSACKAGSGSISPVLSAMGIKPELAQSAIRISLGKQNTEQQIDQFIVALKTITGHSYRG